MTQSERSSARVVGADACSGDLSSRISRGAFTVYPKCGIETQACLMVAGDNVDRNDRRRSFGTD